MVHWFGTLVFAMKQIIVIQKLVQPRSSLKVKKNDVMKHSLPLSTCFLKFVFHSHIHDWMIWAAEKSLGPHCINAIVSSMRVALLFGIMKPAFSAAFFYAHHG